MITSDESVTLVVTDGIATLTLNRPEKRNAMRISDLHQLRDLVAQVAKAWNSIRVVRLQGAGGKIFCAGLEFTDIHQIDWRNNPFTAVCDAVAKLPMATVCAVAGGAFGAGADLAMACDFRLGTPEARIRMPAAALGVHYDQTGLERAVRVLGLPGAKRMYLAAQQLDAEALLRLGFLDEIIAVEDYAVQVDEWVQRLAALAPVAVRDLKASLHNVAAGEVDAVVIANRIARNWGSEDFREGAVARDEHRPPKFTGAMNDQPRTDNPSGNPQVASSETEAPTGPRHPRRRMDAATAARWTDNPFIRIDSHGRFVFPADMSQPARKNFLRHMAERQVINDAPATMQSSGPAIQWDDTSQTEREPEDE